MKKNFIFVLLGLFLILGGVNAQNYRKWDFTQWSATTIANLQADAAASSTTGWSDIEKAADAGDGKVAPDATRNKCFWYDSSEGGTLKANGATISELEGLDFGSSYSDNRSLAIAVNYPETSLGTYAGPAYLWLGGGNKAAGSRLLCFTIPNVQIGQKITMVVESHNPTQARGISLFVNDINVEANRIGESFTPTTQDTYTWENWTLPDGVEDEDGDGMVDILVYNTNGCHIYSIEVGNADQKSKIAYLYQGVADATQAVAESIANYEVEAIDVTATQKTAEELRSYDAVIIASNVNDATYAAELKNALGWTPIVNTSYGLYELWGLGTAVPSAPFVSIKSEGHSLFNGIEIIDEGEIKGIAIEGEVYGIQDLGDYFASDVIVGAAIDDETVTTIHVHNATHNAYIYIPAGNEQLTINAIKAVANSKAKVTAAPKPVISLDYKNMNTDVTITSGVPSAQIFYTTDGSMPSENSTVYTGTFNVATVCTVKAVAKGDGYTLSEVAESEVIMKQQAAVPTIAVEKGNGQTTITIKGEGELWYSYSDTNDTTKASKYTAPIVVKMPRTIYAFACEDNKVNSEVAVADAEVDGFEPRIDILAHMDANSAEYNGGSTATTYFFSWTKNKGDYPYYVIDSRTETEGGVDPETGDPIINVTYTEMSPEEEVDFENGWMVRSRGQLVIWENQTTGTAYGNTDSYNYATVDDENEYFPATKSYINLADKNTQPSDVTFPYNAYITTISKFKGPFDIVINAGSITKPDSPGTHTVVLQVSTDGNVWESNWQTVGDTIVLSNIPRLTKNVTRSYEGTDEVYVRAYLAGNNSKVGFYDIYIANAGEKSAELKTGIVEQKNETTKQAVGIYNLSGVRQQGMKRGLNIIVEADGTVKKVMVK